MQHQRALVQAFPYQMELAGLQIKEQGGNYAVTIRDLQPEQPWTLRVAPLKEDGKAGPRLFAIDFATPPKASFLPEVSILRGILFVLGLLVVWRVYAWWRNRYG